MYSMIGGTIVKTTYNENTFNTCNIILGGKSIIRISNRGEHIQGLSSILLYTS